MTRSYTQPATRPFQCLHQRPNQTRLANAQNGSRDAKRSILIDRKLDALLGAVDEDMPTEEEATERYEALVMRLEES